MAAVVKRLIGAHPRPIPKPYVILPDSMGSAEFPQNVYTGHVQYTSTLSPPPGLRVVVLLRDPRDILVSKRDFIASRKFDTFDKILPQFMALSRDDQFRAVINPPREFRGTITHFRKHCRGFVDWIAQGATIFRYEDFFTEIAADKLAKALDFPHTTPEQVQGKESGLTVI